MLSPSMKKKVLSVLCEDVGRGDITSALVPSKRCSAFIVAKSSGVLAGVEESVFLFRSKKVKVIVFKKDGEKVVRGARVMRVEGLNKNILMIERTVLNFLGRMSGIATATAKAVKIAGKNCMVSGTRKTAPGLNLFDKKAVVLGGGLAHRTNLNEMVLLKENHLMFFDSVACAVKKAKDCVGKKVFEVEVENVSQAREAARAGAPIIMLDNFSVKNAKKAIKEIRALNPNAKIEVSGGITFKNLKKYSLLKPDWVSMGCLTKNVLQVDFSLEVKK
jgi:nicotinate-nucleotide pyrophosphorylase (carboxylating)